MSAIERSASSGDRSGLCRSSTSSTWPSTRSATAAASCSAANGEISRSATWLARASMKSPTSTAGPGPQSAFTVLTPRRSVALSIRSSCTSDPACSTSTHAADVTALSVTLPRMASAPARIRTDRKRLPPAAVMRPENSFTIGREDEVAIRRISSSTRGSARARAGIDKPVVGAVVVDTSRSSRGRA